MFPGIAECLLCLYFVLTGSSVSERDFCCGISAGGVTVAGVNSSEFIVTVH